MSERSQKLFLSDIIELIDAIQLYVIYPDCNGRENIFINGAIIGMSQVEI